MRARSLVAEERQLAGDAGGRFLEIGYGDAKKADALGCREERAHKLDACLAQEIVSRDCGGEAAASGHQPEVRELCLHGHGSAESLRFLAPSPDIIRHGLHASLDFGWLA